MTQVDGALVLDYAFRPRVLGATLLETGAAGKVVGGHRKKAVRSAVGEVPGSFGFVVPHDGTTHLVTRDQAGAVIDLPLAL